MYLAFVIAHGMLFDRGMNHNENMAKTAHNTYYFPASKFYCELFHIGFDDSCKKFSRYA